MVKYNNFSRNISLFLLLGRVFLDLFSVLTHLHVLRYHLNLNGGGYVQNLGLRLIIVILFFRLVGFHFGNAVSGLEWTCIHALEFLVELSEVVEVHTFW